jgi:hypothetical protein
LWTRRFCSWDCRASRANSGNLGSSQNVQARDGPVGSHSDDHRDDPGSNRIHPQCRAHCYNARAAYFTVLKRVSGDPSEEACGNTRTIADRVGEVGSRDSGKPRAPPT